MQVYILQTLGNGSKKSNRVIFIGDGLEFWIKNVGLKRLIQQHIREHADPLPGLKELFEAVFVGSWC